MITELPNNGTRTSRAAARSMAGKSAALRNRILSFIDARGLMGATADEIESALNIPGNTVRPRLCELRGGYQHEQKIFDSKRTRRTRSGRHAVVYLAIVFEKLVQ